MQALKPAENVWNLSAGPGRYADELALDFLRRQLSSLVLIVKPCATCLFTQHRSGFLAFGDFVICNGRLKNNKILLGEIPMNILRFSDLF